jgi:hypothetical protein
MARQFSLNLCLLTVTALLAAPIVGAIASSLIYATIHTQFGTQYTILNLLVGAMFTTVMGVISAMLFIVPSSFILGWPIHLILMRIGLTGFMAYTCVSATLTAVLARLLPGFYTGPLQNDVELHLLAAVAGAVGGVVFWLIRRPDRAAPIASPTP